MPDELAAQLPIIKNVIAAMNIKVIEMPGYEADDILGTHAKNAEKQGKETILLTGDRDSFQLASDKITIRIPRTKAGKTEVEDFDRSKIFEVYGLEPTQFIEVKGLMGDTSDNIPGVPGVGEKTALNLIKEFGSVAAIYEKLENGEQVAKGKLKENLENNKDLAILSRELGRIDLEAPIEKELSVYKVQEWDKKKVLEIFKELRFNRYIERFDLENENTVEEKDAKELFDFEELNDSNIEELLNSINSRKEIYYYLENIECNDESLIIKKKINYIYIYNPDKNKVYSSRLNKEIFKDIFENKEIMKISNQVKEDYILLKQEDINSENMMFDTKIAAYVLNATSNAYSLEEIARLYLDLDITEYSGEEEKKEVQTSLFDMADFSNEEEEEKANFKSAIKAYVIGKSKDKLVEELTKQEELDLFNNIEMPVAQILAEMQWEGMYIDEKELIKYGNNLKEHIEELRIDIYKLADEEFNINSTIQLGGILFEKLKLTPSKKTKSGYSTDVDALEKLKGEHPIIEKI